jgi:hypothetical protein
MTTFASARAPQAAPSIGAVTVRWAIASPNTAELAITVDDRSASAVLTVGSAATPAGDGGPVHHERADGLEHIDVAGVVSMTLRRGTDGSLELLYARTPLLESLGVPGGCVEPPLLGAANP